MIIDQTTRDLLLLGSLLLMGAPVKQIQLLYSASRHDPDLDTMAMFALHGLASLGIGLFLCYDSPRQASYCLVIIGMVSTWIYWIRPLYKNNDTKQ